MLFSYGLRIFSKVPYLLRPQNLLTGTFKDAWFFYCFRYCIYSLEGVYYISSYPQANNLGNCSPKNLKKFFPHRGSLAPNINLEKRDKGREALVFVGSVSQSVT